MTPKRRYQLEAWAFTLFLLGACAVAAGAKVFNKVKGALL